MALPRRMAAGERLNEAPHLPAIIAEVEAMGRPELRRCESLLIPALEHPLKLHAWPDSPAARPWRVEAPVVPRDATRAYTPSLRQRINLAKLYAYALDAVRLMGDGSGPPRSFPVQCPFAMEHLLAPPPDMDPLRAMAGRAS